MEQSDTFIKELCNELAQPVTTLTLALELIELGVAVPQDYVVMRAEVERLNQIVQTLRMTDSRDIAFLVA